MIFSLDGTNLDTTLVSKLARNPNTCLEISPSTCAKIDASYNALKNLTSSGRIIYGVTTGMGGFVDRILLDSERKHAQVNLLSSVATNVGPYFDDVVVRAAMLARINSLARGSSGISKSTFKQVIDIFNAGIVPCVPELGSLGASGDLGPLAQISLVLIGRGKARWEGTVYPGDVVLNLCNLKPVELEGKDGLALINGTSFMSGLASLIVEDALELFAMYELISSLSIEALSGKRAPFNDRVHKEKLHGGQRRVAKRIWKYTQHSNLTSEEENTHMHLQDGRYALPIEDAYSIRCTPQVLGPVIDYIQFAKEIVNKELNSTNDNPLILVDPEEVFHAGHFHGQYIAFAMDTLMIALTTLSNLSDRRTDRLLDSSNNFGLPDFLCAEEQGIRFGLMGGQFMSTSLTAENRSLCSPVSTHTLSSTANFQDIVSLGLVSARHCKTILNNVYYIIGFELICACKAIKIRGLADASPKAKEVFEVTWPHIENLLDNDELSECLTEIASRLQKGLLTDLACIA